MYLPFQLGHHTTLGRIFQPLLQIFYCFLARMHKRAAALPGGKAAALVYFDA
jgi:hypothetical protein